MSCHLSLLCTRVSSCEFTIQTKQGAIQKKNTAPQLTCGQKLPQVSVNFLILSVLVKLCPGCLPVWGMLLLTAPFYDQHGILKTCHSVFQKYKHTNACDCSVCLLNFSKHMQVEQLDKLEQYTATKTEGASAEDGELGELSQKFYQAAVQVCKCVCVFMCVCVRMGLGEREDG